MFICEEPRWKVWTMGALPQNCMKKYVQDRWKAVKKYSNTWKQYSCLLQWVTMSWFSFLRITSLVKRLSHRLLIHSIILTKLSAFSAGFYSLRRKPWLQKEQIEKVLVALRDRLLLKKIVRILKRGMKSQTKNEIVFPWLLLFYIMTKIVFHAKKVLLWCLGKNKNKASISYGVVSILGVAPTVAGNL